MQLLCLLGTVITWGDMVPSYCDCWVQCLLGHAFQKRSTPDISNTNISKYFLYQYHSLVLVTFQLLLSQTIGILK